MCSAKICFCFPYRFHRTQRRTLQRRVNGLHVKAHGKRIADTPGGFPHIDGEGGEERRAGGVEQGSLVPKLLQSFSGLHCHPETPLTPPVSPLSSPSLPSSTALKLLPFLCVSSPPPPPLNALTYWPLTPPPGLSVLCYHPLLTPLLPPPSPSRLPRLTAFVVTHPRIKIIVHTSSYGRLFVRGGALSLTSPGFTVRSKLH